MAATYQSKYTEKPVTVANHITEILMERLAKKEKRTLLPHFWLDQTWKKQYNTCLVQVTRLLAAYSEKAIIQTIRENEWAFSMAPLKNKVAINEQKLKLKEHALEASKIEFSEVVPNVEFEERKTFGGNKLGNLD